MWSRLRTKMLDSKKYINRFDEIKALLDRQKPQDRLQFTSEVAVATSVPILVVTHYYGQLYGFTDDVIDKLNYLKKFYNTDVK
jgi:ABC-type molybdate transport system ATPase subunit